MLKFIILITVSSAFALPNPETEKLDKVKLTKKECASGILSPACLKIGALTILEKLNTKDEVALIPGVSLVKEGEQKGKYEGIAAEIARSMASNPEERLDKFLVYNVGAFLDSHSVKLKLVDDSAVEEAKKVVDEGRGNKDPLSVGGKKGGMGGLIAMAMMMKGTDTLINLILIYHTTYKSYTH